MDRKGLLLKLYDKFGMGALMYQEDVAYFILSLPQTSGLVPLDYKEIVILLKELLLTPKILELKPTIAELEKILNSEEGQSLAMLPNGEISCVNPKISIEGITKAICQKFGQQKLHACKCRNGKEIAMTVKRLDDRLFQCPRCGGIIVGNRSSEGKE